MRERRKYCGRGHELTPENIYIRVRRGAVEHECKACCKSRRIYVGGGFKVAVKLEEPVIAKAVFNVQQYFQDYKTKVLNKLGNKCNECGFTNPDALQFHHKKHDGFIDKQILGLTGVSLFKQILADQNNRFEILCANCHIIKHKLIKKAGVSIKAGG